ncbi:MAG TPA: hypothetical protein VF591_22315 [Pyrinomonadaceae bacterium]
MEKFYAPTGVFRPGPISIPKESAEAVDALRIESGVETAELEPSKENDISPVNAPHISIEDTPLQEPTQHSAAEVGPVTPPSSIVPEEIPDRFTSTPQPTESTPDKGAEASAHTTLPDSQIVLFTEFADRWKRYLYPGQLAVMRALYELTFPHGTSECFTRYSELAASTKMSRRNCINVMNSLVERGFVERLEIRNDANGKGIKLRVHLDPL